MALLALLAACMAARVAAQEPTQPWSYELAFDRGSTVPFAVITAYTGPAGSAVIPAEIDGHPVRTVGGGRASIDPSSKLTGVVIPDSVTKLADYAFWRPTNLANVSLGAGVKSIGYGAFGYAGSLVEIDLPDSVNALGNYVFYRATNLGRVTLGQSLTNIPFAAFSDCPKLRELVIPEGVKSIGDFAFNAVTYRGGLTNVVFPASLEQIGRTAFQHCAGLTSISLPAGLRSIGQEAFAYCAGLTNLVLGDGVTEVGRAAFAFCDNLLSVRVGSAMSVIADSLFDGCLGLVSVVISGPVSSVGDFAFADGPKLTSVLFTGPPPAIPGNTGDVFGTNTQVKVYHYPDQNGWPASWAGRTTAPFRPVAQQASVDRTNRAFSFFWSGTGDVPMSVERATSLVNGPWETVGEGISSRSFTDEAPPRRAAFYRVLHR